MMRLRMSAEVRKQGQHSGKGDDRNMEDAWQGVREWYIRVCSHYDRRLGRSALSECGPERESMYCQTPIQN